MSTYMPLERKKTQTKSHFHPPVNTQAQKYYLENTFNTANGADLEQFGRLSTHMRVYFLTTCLLSLEVIAA